MEYFIQTVYAGQIPLVPWLYLGLSTLSTLIFRAEQRKPSVPAVFWKVSSDKAPLILPLLLLLLFLQLFRWLETEALLRARLMSCIVIGARRGARGCIGPCVCWSLCIKPCVSMRVCVRGKKKSVWHSGNILGRLCIESRTCGELMCFGRMYVKGWMLCVYLYETALYLCVCVPESVCWAWARVSVTVQYLSHSY